MEENKTETNSPYFNLAAGLARAQGHIRGDASNVRVSQIPTEEIPFRQRIAILEKLVQELLTELQPIKNALSDLYEKIG